MQLLTSGLKWVKRALGAAAITFAALAPSHAQFTDRLDGTIASLAIKAPCRVATTANITLFGLQTIDGVTVVSGDRVLVKDQTNATENGIYLASASTWTRAKDFDGNRDAVQGTIVLVRPASNGTLFYELTTANPVVFGTSAITFEPADPGVETLTNQLADTSSAAAGPALVGNNPMLSYPVGTVGWALNDSYLSRVAGDGVTDDTATLAADIAFCQANQRSLKFRPGSIVKLSSTITLSGNPISFIGEADAALQQGSQLPSVTLRWTGGAAAMFDMQSSGWSFVGLAVENRGTATDFIYSSSGTQYLTLDRTSFLVASGATRFSRSILKSLNNNFGYSKFRNLAFQGAAPAFLDIDGNASSNGVTSIEFDGGLYESNSLGNVTIVKAKDINLTALSIHNATWNQQDNELTIVDTTDTPRSVTLTQFSFKDNEVDTVTNAAGNRSFKLTNALNVEIDNNYFQGGGTRTAFATLVNTQVSSFKGNRGERINGPFFSADTLSNVVIGKNEFSTANTQGIINDAATGSGIVPLTYGTTVTIEGNKLGPGQTALVNVTNGTGWTLTFVHPGISSGGFFYRGQKFALRIKNSSGGAMGAITINTTYFKVAGGALPVPANGFSRVVDFEWDGTALYETGRTTTDVPN